MVQTMATEGDIPIMPISGDCGSEQTVTANKPVEEKRHHLQGGYECIFVKNPPDHLQTECPVCLCVLKEPYLIDCCGNSFCRTCIEPIKTKNRPCPLCNVQFTTTIPDKRLHRTLNELQVYCCHKEVGCEWLGELGTLTQHLNLNPHHKGDKLTGCQLAGIMCAFCGEDIQRKYIKKHEEDICPERLFCCEYCGEYESSYIDVTANHWPECPSRPVRCPNECGMSPKLEMLDDHCENECPLQLIECPFKYVGCNERLLRKDMSDHITQSLALHMSLQAINHQQELKKLKSHITEVESQLKKSTELQQQSAAKIAELCKMNQLLVENEKKSAAGITDSRVKILLLQKKGTENMAEIADLRIKNQLLQEKLDQECKARVATVAQELKKAQEQKLKGHLGNLRGEMKKALSEAKQDIMKQVDSEMAVVHNHVGLVPFTFIMPNFEQKKSSNSSWYSPSFYTHPRGYKMCLRVDANGNGDGKNSHVSVFLYMMQGEYDESLTWPFRGNIVVQLLDQVENDRHHQVAIDVPDNADDGFCQKVLLGKRSPQGWGQHQFISHSKLLPTNNYLKDDCLKFSIKLRN